MPNLHIVKSLEGHNVQGCFVVEREGEVEEGQL